MPSLGAEVARFHIPPIPPTEFLVLLLVSPALGVIAGAVAYAIAKQSDRRYMSMVQEGHLALLKEAHHAANIYMKVDGEILEFRSTRTDDPVNGANGSQLPKPGSTDDIEGWQAFSQVKPRFPFPGGCTYQVRS